MNSNVDTSWTSSSTNALNTSHVKVYVLHKKTSETNQEYDRHFWQLVKSITRHTE